MTLRDRSALGVVLEDRAEGPLLEWPAHGVRITNDHDLKFLGTNVRARDTKHVCRRHRSDTGTIPIEVVVGQPV